MPEHQQIQQSKKTNTIFQKRATPVIQTPLSNPYSIIQRAKINPKSLTHADVMQLQRTIGNRAVAQLLSGVVNSSTAHEAPIQRSEIPEDEEKPMQGKFETVQRSETPEEEEPLQGKMVGTVQKQEIPEEEEPPMQGKFGSIQRQEIPPEEEKCPSCIQKQETPEEEEPFQGKMIEPVQRQETSEEEEPLQGKFENSPGQVTCPSCFASSIVQKQESEEEEKPLQGKMIGTIQRQEIPEEDPLQGKMAETVQHQEIPEEEPLQTKRENNTRMPDNLKAGVESLSGIDMSGVRVHYNSDKPAEVGALAYTQGTNIHVAPGQEKHLPHESWHVVQQAQGRVMPKMHLKDGVPVNDDAGLEKEADIMGLKASNNNTSQIATSLKSSHLDNTLEAIQRVPQAVKIVWMVTHVVKEMDESLFGRGGFEEGEIGSRGELTEGQTITIDDSDIFVSRRGPNQEDQTNRERNCREEPSIDWYRVLVLHDKDVSGENLYVRSGTFIPVEQGEKIINIEDSKFDSEVKQVMQKYLEVIKGYGDGSSIKNVQDFEKLFASAGIQGSLHEGENAEIMKTIAGRTSLIEIIKAALHLALRPMQDQAHADIRDKLISQGFTAKGCVAARITELSEVMGKTIRILEAVQHQEEFLQFNDDIKAKENIHSCIRGIFEQYKKNEHRSKQLKKYQSQMQACSAAYGAISVLSYLNTQQVPASIVPLYNILSRIATKLASVSNLSKVFSCITNIAGEYEVYSGLLIVTFPDLLKIFGGAEYPDEIGKMSDHMIYGTMPSKESL